jgi:hypothetical protein
MFGQYPHTIMKSGSTSIKLRCSRPPCTVVPDARRHSVFAPAKFDQRNGLGGNAPYFDWATRFEHGTSQIIDWIRIFDDHRQTSDFRAHFGIYENFDPQFLLVIGRDEFLDPHMRARMKWRSKSISAANHRIRCVTYDEVLGELKYQDDVYPDAALASTQLTALPDPSP